MVVAVTNKQCRQLLRSWESNKGKNVIIAKGRSLGIPMAAQVAVCMARTSSFASLSLLLLGARIQPLLQKPTHTVNSRTYFLLSPSVYILLSAKNLPLDSTWINLGLLTSGKEQQWRKFQAKRRINPSERCSQAHNGVMDTRSIIQVVFIEIDMV